MKKNRPNSHLGQQFCTKQLVLNLNYFIVCFTTFMCAFACNY